MSRELCRDVPDFWGCSETLCKKRGLIFQPLKRGTKNDRLHSVAATCRSHACQGEVNGLSCKLKTVVGKVPRQSAQEAKCLALEEPHLTSLSGTKSDGFAKSQVLGPPELAIVVHQQCWYPFGWFCGTKRVSKQISLYFARRGEIRFVGDRVSDLGAGGPKSTFSQARKLATLGEEDARFAANDATATAIWDSKGGWRATSQSADVS